MIRQAIERFGRPEEQITTRLERTVNTQQDVFLDLGREVDQHVAAEHDVELAQACVTVEQVERAKFHTTANRRLDRPAPGRLDIEVALQTLLGQATGNRQAVVLTALAVIEHGAGQVGSNNLRAHLQLADVAALELIDRHRDRVRLLPRGTGGRPDTQALPGIGLDLLRQYLVLQHFEGIGVTKPQGFVGGHGIHHLLAQTAARLALNTLHQFSQGLDALLLHQLVETAGDQVLLIFAQQDATGFFQEDPELFEIQITRRQ
ncbi:hypothetical protein D3C78_735850 [compost metagenome]